LRLPIPSFDPLDQACRYPVAFNRKRVISIVDKEVRNPLEVAFTVRRYPRLLRKLFQNRLSHARPHQMQPIYLRQNLPRRKQQSTRSRKWILLGDRVAYAPHPSQDIICYCIPSNITECSGQSSRYHRMASIEELTKQICAIPKGGQGCPHIYGIVARENFRTIDQSRFQSQQPQSWSAHDCLF